MKRVAYSRKFEKSYKSRIVGQKKLKAAYAKRFRNFCAGERGKPLNDHPLTGDMRGLRSYSVTGDYRVVYRETADYYEFLDVGTHNQVYK